VTNERAIPAWEPARLVESRALVALADEAGSDLLALTWALACMHETQEQVDRYCPRGFVPSFARTLVTLRRLATGDVVLANWDDDNGRLTRESYMRGPHP
jgi:hypothetical protein